MTASPAPTTDDRPDPAAPPSGSPRPSLRVLPTLPRRRAGIREERTAHVFRTLGRGLVAEYGPG